MEGACASVEETMVAINAACKAKGGAHATYSCKVVSWDDVSRGTVGSSGLSCWGANITDTYLKSEDGAQLFTVRSDNWNEKLGRIGTDEICVVTGNQEPGGKELQPITLRDFLKQGGTHGGYAGLGLGTDLSDDELDQNVSIRFQTTFLRLPSARSAARFCSGPAQVFSGDCACRGTDGQST